MKKNKIQKLNKLNNKGVTLVEIIVAMAILAVVVVPFVHSFVTAANTNRKSRETLNGTTIAEDIMELFEDANVQNETANIKSIIDAKVAAGLDVADAGSVSSDANGVYTIEMGSDVLAEYIGESFVNDGYSAKVVLDPCNVATKDDGTLEDGRYKDVNVTQGNLASITNINGKTSGLFSMKKNADEAEFDLIEADGNGGKLDDIKANTKRTIKIDIMHNGTHAPTGIEFVKVRVTINYEYGGKTYTSQSVVYDNTVDISQQAYPLENIFFIYTPIYNNKDSIIVNNDHNVQVSLYLIHEESNNGDINYSSYKVPITIVENQASTDVELSSYKASVRIFTNLYKESALTDIDSYFSYSLDSTKVNYSITYYPSTSSSIYTNDFAICNRILDIRSADGRYLFGNAVTKNRIYDMEVTVYKNGRKVIDISGTKTD